MNGKVFTINSRCDGKLVEEVHEVVVGFLIVVLHALVPKVEVSCALASLMVSPEHDYIVRVGKFHCTEICNDFRSVHASIYVVAHEDELVDPSTVCLNLV